FSSRRRHTRSKRDWSSDVCSSDLTDSPLPISTASVLTYVPFEQAVSTSKWMRLSSLVISETLFRLYIFTVLLGRSTVFPSLAYSYSFLPFTLTEEYIGTCCS